MIHQQGHAEYDRESGKVKDSDVTKSVDVLQATLENIQQSEAAEDFTVQMNALKTLQKLDNDAALREAEARLDKLMASVGLSDNNTVGEYVLAKLVPMIEDRFPSIPEEVQKKLTKRIVGADGVKVTDVTKGLERSVKAEISAFVKEGKKIMGNIIAPLESIVHDFSVEMLRGLQSAFVLDNEKEVKRLAGEVKTAIDAIENSGRDDVMNVMAKHLQKIGGAENISTAAEGFVFDWDGITYKFTGNFAPANQILGIFKYGRGKMPALQKEVIAEAPTGRRVGIVPGGFKPPHAGHYMGAEYLITNAKADEVHILIGPKTREGFSQDGDNKIKVTKRQSLALWELYIEANGMVGKMFPQIPGGKTPIDDTFNFVVSNMENGDTVLLGKGEKDASDRRFDGMKSFITKKGLDQVEVEQVNTPMFASGITGTEMRRLIADNEVDKFKKQLPLKSADDLQAAWEIVSTENEQDAADDKEKLPQLHKYSESKIGKPIEHFYFDKKYYSRSSLNYLLGLVFLKKNIKNFVPKTFLEIGGGYGTLGEILFHSKIKKIKYINIDIPPLSLVSEYYLTKNFGKKNVESYLNNRYKNKINLYKLKKKITCLCSWQIERLVGKIDIFVNFISFQEMEPKVVKNYIYHINRLSPKFILLRNLKEGKQIKSTKIHGVLKQIKKNDYIKFLKTNYVLVNSNVRPYGFKTYDNFNSELLLFKKK